MKKYYTGCILIFATLFISVFSSGNSTFAADPVLQDDSLLVVFDSNTGALVHLERKSTHWIIERRAELGVSFRMHVPLPERRYNFILGQKQHADRIEKISDTEIRLRWKNLVSEYGGILPITLTANVTLTEGILTFKMTIENDSPLMIESIDYPYFGDLVSPASNTGLLARTMWYGNLESDEIYPHFTNSKGYWGDFYPTKTFDSNRSLFCLIQAHDQGLYVEMHDPAQPYLLQYTFEQHPGVIQSVNNPVPESEGISGLPVHLEFRTCHFIFIHPGATVQLVPVTLRCYSGNWQAGADLYKQWRVTWFKPAHTPVWIRDVNSWLQLQINSPEQDYRVHYSDLVKYGEECAANGVKAIQLVGWNVGGQDGGDPSQDTDPGLGTWKELYDAIHKIQDMGVRIILFGKLNWADKTTDWFKRELYKYACTDPYGIPYEQGGYSYYTPTQLAGINNHRRAVMDFLCPDYQSLIVNEFQKVLDLGASGWLFDENCHHGPVKYSFSPDHGYTPPGFIYAGDMPLASELRNAANKVSSDFLFAGEGHMDWMMQYYPCSYFRINGGSTPIDRYIDPKAPLVVAVTGLDDREMLNLILMDRYIISYEPYNFKGHVTDFPLTLAYGKKIDALRLRYKTWLWDAEFRDTKGAQVTANGSFRYSVFVTTGGKRAIVVVNNEPEKGIVAQVKLHNPGKLVTATPEQPESVPLADKIQIPPRSAIVVMEQ
jgi:hypothetical protein